MLIPLRVREIALDGCSGQPVVLLVNEKGDQVLPIWVGPFEAQAISMALEGVLTPRPMTHDLLKNFCQSLGAEIGKVVIVDIRHGTYYAEISLNWQGDEIKIDARPSDAIALALRANTGLYMKENVARFARPLEELLGKSDAKDGERKPAEVVDLEEYKKTLH